MTDKEIKKWVLRQPERKERECCRLTRQNTAREILRELGKSDWYFIWTERGLVKFEDTTKFKELRSEYLDVEK